MKILFDHCVPKPFRRLLPGHEIRTTGELGWSILKNGALLAQAAAAGFDVFLTVDKNVQHQHNLASLPLAIVILDVPRNTPETVAPCAPFVLAEFAQLRSGHLVLIDPTGKITRITP